MCGIAGIINNNNPTLIHTLSEKLSHRGPDAQSTYTENNLTFIHTRLAIQDIKHGKQPWHRNDHVIIFNGQIYNHLALRQTYLKEEVFLTQSDTETLLAMYIKFGKDMFQYIDGMFAFAIFNRTKNELFLARDRAGKKPLYYYQNSHVFAFASELNALKSTIDLTINHTAIQSFLECGFFFKQYTPYNEVTEVLAGEFLTLDLNSHKLHKTSYFDFLACYQHPKLTLDLPQAVDLVEKTLKNSVQDRLFSSELEVGAFLSGGIDSSLVVAMAAELTPKLKTFTIAFEGAYDESWLARLTAKRYQTEHVEINIHMHVADDLEKILCSYGEPFLDSSAIPSYYVSREAKKYATVILNGDGADELFAGYRRYVPIANHWLKFAAHLHQLTALLPKPTQKQSKYNYLYRLLSIAGKKGIDFYTSATTDIFNDHYNFSANPITEKANQFIADVQGLSSLSDLDKMLYLDFNLLLFSDLLVKMDIATMQHALEARSPFLSKDMLTLASQLPDKYKIHGTQTKFILRNLAKKYLPLDLINQPKRGFEIPLKNWLETILKEKLFYYLEGAPCVAAYVKNTFIQSLLKNQITISQEKRAKILWTLLATEIWLRNGK